MIRGYDSRFGQGFISGVIGVVLGALGLGAVLCLRFRALLTTPDARAIYPMDALRFLIHLVLVGSFCLGALSIVLSRRTPERSGAQLVVPFTRLPVTRLR